MDTPAQPIQQHFSYKTLLILMCFLTLSLAFLIIVFISQNPKANKIVLQPTNKSVQPSLTPSDPTANWKTCINPSLNISLKYPNNWYADIHEGNCDSIHSYDPNKLSPVQRIGPVGKNQLKLELRRPIDFDPLKQNLKEYIANKTSGNQVMAQEQSEFKLNDYNVIKLILTSKTEFSGYQFVIYYIEFKQKVYTISVYPADSVLFHYVDSILPTFKILDQQQTIDTSNWKTYTDEKLAITFKYPNDSHVGKHILGGDVTNIKVSFIGKKQLETGKTQTDIFDGYSFNINVQDNSKKETVDSIITRVRQEAVSPTYAYNCPHGTFTDIQSTRVGEKPARTFSSTCVYDIIVEERTQYFIVKDNMIFELTLICVGSESNKIEYKRIQDHILQTFKFTQ